MLQHFAAYITLGPTMQRTLATARLVLRPFNLADAASVQRLAGDARIARGTTAVPHPYADSVAEAWIGGQSAAYDTRREIVFAVVERQSEAVVGAVSLLNISARHARAELGFWIGVAFWSQGFCSEAVREVVRFGQDDLQITKFVGRCLAWNSASAAVMRKAGFELEGRLIKQELREGMYVDQLVFGLVLPGRDSET